MRMIVCQACGSQNLDSSQYCDECGDSLQKYQAPDASQVSEVNPEHEDSEADVPVFQSASVTSVGVPSLEEEETSVSRRTGADTGGAVDSDGEQVPKKAHAKLVIERGHAIGTEFLLTAGESNIGRWDADNGVFPDVDLDAHDPEAKVSRRHARILYTNGSYMIEDLGSTNGTFVNRGRRLIPGNPQRLNDGDEIIVGKTFLRLVVLD